MRDEHLFFSPSDSNEEEEEEENKRSEFAHDAADNSNQSERWSAERLLSSTYRDLGTPKDVSQRFLHYLLSSSDFGCLSSVTALLLAEPSTTRDFSLRVNAFDLTRFDPVLGNLLLRFPQPMISLLEDTIVEAQRVVARRIVRAIRQRRRKEHNNGSSIAGSSDGLPRGQHLVIKGENNSANGASETDSNGDENAKIKPPTMMTRVHARLVHLPPHPSFCRPSISSLTSSDVGRIVQLCGTVVRASAVQMYESARAYVCTSSSCRHAFVVNADLHQSNNALPIPTVCPSDAIPAPKNPRSPPGGSPQSSRKCRGTKFAVIPGNTVRTDYQEIKIQESHAAMMMTASKSSSSSPQKRSHQGGAASSSKTPSPTATSSSSGAAAGGMPASLLVKLQHDLVDQCQPGDDVVVVGTLISQWQPVYPNVVSDVNMALYAHSIRVINTTTGSADCATWDVAGKNGLRRAMNGSKQDNCGPPKDELEYEFEDLWSSARSTGRSIATRNFISRAICPKLYGMYIIKLAMLVTLIGGSGSANDAKNATRSSSSSPDSKPTKGGNKCRTDAHPNDQDEQNRDDEGDETTDNDRAREHDDGDDSANDDDEEEDDEENDDDEPEQFIADNTDVETIKNPPHSYRSPRKNTSAIESDHTRNNNAQKSETPKGRRSKKNSANGDLFPVVLGSGKAVRSRRREQSHLLLVGDPGTGKSQFLRFAAALCPRSVLTTGVGTTSAGLTCAAVRDGSNGEFTLEAGALVLADKGVCCIDEFGCIRDSDRATIHEAMEQQTLSVAKAGIVCKLNCRATVIAVTNPRNGLYNDDESLVSNTGIASPLLSRFDLIFKLVDSSSEARDSNVAEHLLNRAIQGSGYDCATRAASEGNDQQQQHWPMDKLRSYIATVKANFQPIMSDDAAELLQRHYRKCREVSSRTVQKTVRFLESLIRLSQAHARLMYRNVVELDDAVATVLLMECTASTLYGYEDNFIRDKSDISLYVDPMDIDFPSDDSADFQFLCHKYLVLCRYGMEDKLSQSERARAEAEMFDNGNKDDGNNGDGWLRYEGLPAPRSEYEGNFDVGGNYGAQENYCSLSQSVDQYGRVSKSPQVDRRMMMMQPDSSQSSSSTFRGAPTTSATGRMESARIEHTSEAWADGSEIMGTCQEERAGQNRTSHDDDPEYDPDADIVARLGERANQVARMASQESSTYFGVSSSAPYDSVTSMSEGRKEESQKRKKKKRRRRE